MNSRLLRAGGLFMSAMLLMSGCAQFEPDHKRPELVLPDTWGPAIAPEARTLSASTAAGEWWKLFNDEALNRQIDEALKHNAGVALAVARVDEARAQLTIAGADRLPTVSGSIARSRSESSQRTAVPLPAGVPREANSYRATIDVAWEIDLWNRLKNTQSAARAELLASEAARDAVKLTLAADVAQGWFALESLGAQLADTRRALATRVAGLALQKRRYEAGMISEFEWRQLESEVAATEAQIPQIERRYRAQQSALAVLTGRTPRAVFESSTGPGTDSPAPRGATPMVVPSGLPSELLLRRPDIVAAEHRLVAANARIPAARAAVFPSLALTGFLGSQSVVLTDLFSGPAGIWSLAAALTQPIFSGGRQDAAVAVLTARERQALLLYQSTVQASFRDVRDALDAQLAAREQWLAELRRADALGDALRLAQLRHDNGLASRLDVLDAERNHLAARINLSEARRAQRAAIADLFKALGGGW